MIRIEILRELEGKHCKFKIKEEIKYIEKLNYGQLFEGELLDGDPRKVIVKHIDGVEMELVKEHLKHSDIPEKLKKELASMQTVKKKRHAVTYIDHIYVWEHTNNEELHVYVVMEKINGPTLHDLYIHKLKQASTPQEVKEAKQICLNILKQASLALEEIYPIRHWDLKPPNIILEIEEEQKKGE